MDKVPIHIPMWTPPDKPKPPPRKATRLDYERANRGKATRKPGSNWKRLEILAEKEGWICALCHKPIDPKARGGYEATLDHMTPLSLGGKRGLHNCQLAHRLCNNSRGNKPLNSDS